MSGSVTPKSFFKFGLTDQIFFMSKFLAAAIQLNSQPNLDENLEQIFLRIKTASEAGAQFIALPENFAFMGNEKERLNQAGMIAVRVEKYLSEWAKEFRVTILGGGYPVPAAGGKVCNRAIVVNPGGETIAVYDKIHLFDVELSPEEIYKESAMVEAGKKAVTVNLKIPDICLGLSICYDIRFPELYNILSARGSELICIPAAFTKPTGRAHWETLLRARAIENSCFVIAPAQTGKHGEKRETHGHSMIIDPWGAVLANAGTEPGMAIAEIDTAVLNDVRRKLPSLRHRVSIG